MSSLSYKKYDEGILIFSGQCIYIYFIDKFLSGLFKTYYKDNCYFNGKDRKF